ncbi:Crp/Fnr family transcriptional regulator [Edaphobacter albus]|uniref:Crp/Fnr family transcriptional regulator n=1 Tax=Edaphobacter sp. 4G125 TaxID=2763071 RepID=UPI001645422B|nr:Crp/Fnr family transcriptional regulator [Edaphobacter sp. 4G125]QNI37666.1 Crp/Fnr family transcriptional regulator [Edaphobacter sp. 4G125]
MERIAALRRTKLFSEVNTEGIAKLAQRATEMQFQPGEMLFFSGDTAKGLFAVVSGKVRVFRHNTEGREQVMHMDTAGATIGEVPVFDDGSYPASAIAEEATEVLFINKRDIHAFCLEHPTFALRALKLMAERVRRHAQLVEALSFHEVGQRLALLLLHEARNNGVDARGYSTFKLALSNHEIAIRIGSVRDVVSRALARLQNEGMVIIKRRSVTIPDFHALELYSENRCKQRTASPRLAVGKNTERVQ